MPRQPPTRSFKERFGALRTLRPFMAMVWRTSPPLTASSLVLRLVRALVPVATLYIGKLIIDDVVQLVQMPDRPATLTALAGERPAQLAGRAAAGRVRAGRSCPTSWAASSSLVDSLLSERVTNASSVRLMEHAATLDLEDFEDAEFQDQLERARRQTSGRLTLMAQLFGQAQDIVTVASFAAGLLVYAPWLIVLLLVALVPVFLGEAHFNAQTYTLDFGRTPERRELDYVRQTAASVETAKEVKIFGLNRFLIERYQRLADAFYAANRRARAAPRRRGAALFTAVGTFGYYLAYAYIAWRTLDGALLDRRPHLPRRLVPAAAQPCSKACCWASRRRRARRSISTTCSPSSRCGPEILSPGNPRPFPQPIRAGFRVRGCGLHLSRRRALGGAPSRASRSRPARWWRWWARTAPARPPW